MKTHVSFVIEKRCKWSFFMNTDNGLSTYHTVIVTLEDTRNTEIPGTSSQIKEAVIVLWWGNRNKCVKCATETEQCFGTIASLIMLKIFYYDVKSKVNNRNLKFVTSIKQTENITFLGIVSYDLCKTTISPTCRHSFQGCLFKIYQQKKLDLSHSL